MVEGGGLENRWRGNSLLGSNPSPSAIFSRHTSGFSMLVRKMPRKSILLVIFQAPLGGVLDIRCPELLAWRKG